ncbi:P4 alpha zinc-binding domain-containing protein [Rhizobium leguminosarum]|nr:P4 alpha zinc-binding domain-containing protein [Rhizobium leguminosarum]
MSGPIANSIITDFIDRAHEVTVAEAVDRLGLAIKRGDKGQPCLHCGGKDRFSVNLAKQAWNCRGCSIGGRTGVGLIGFVLGLDLHRKAELLEACATALNETLPDEAERETDEDRAARLERMAKAKAEREAKEADRQREQDKFRQKEIDKARGIYLNATIAPHADDELLRAYLAARTGYAMSDRVFECLRFNPRLSYWHGLDDFGRPISIYAGYAQVAPFVDLTGTVIGSHLTWIDMARAPKYRPDLGRDGKGEPLPTKKMRGAKSGGMIPLCGDMEARRWVGGEGIETVLAVAGYERFDPGTFYFAAGDLGNLAGPADRGAGKSETHVTTSGQKVRVYPFPKPDQAVSDAVQVPDHVTGLVLLADGDSEFYFTAAAMARAKARLSAPGRDINIWWPPVGMDFAGLLSGRA